MDEDWNLLTSFFPGNWKELAVQTNALKGLRQDKSEENLIRTLLIHIGCGYSLRETVVRARKAGLANLSDVALLKRLRKSKHWLYKLCKSMFEERGIGVQITMPQPVRLVDASLVKEPGKTGSLWRIHYSLNWPSLECDYFKLTATEGEGTGESLNQFPVKPGDHFLADRGYSHAKGIGYVIDQQGFVAVRLNPQSLRLLCRKNKPFPLLEYLKPLQKPLQVCSWKVIIPGPNKTKLKGRLCVLRKSQAAIEKAHKKLRQKAIKNGTNLQPQTLIYAKYVMVFSNFSEAKFSAESILEWYRLRWQVELVFKRFKQIVHLGHLPKYDDESAKAWLYGKLFVALLTEKLIAHAESISPWGYFLETNSHTKSLA